MGDNAHAVEGSGNSRFKEHNAWLRAELKAYKDENNYSIGDMAAELACSSTVVSKYLSGKPEGDVARLEAVIDDVLRNAMRRKQAKAQVVETNVTAEIESACERVRKTNDMALIHGPAGVGKTSGIELYAAKNPTSILITISAWRCNARAVASLLWYQIKPRVWNGGGFVDYVVNKLRGSNRLVLVDNAHKLNASGRSVLFDLHDAADLPIALCGNPSVLEDVSSDEQQHSRIGLQCEVRLADTSDLAQALVQQFAPDGSKELARLAEQVIEHQGHGRALRKQLLLARDIKEGSRKAMDWSTAFRAAHTQLIRNYKLED